MVTLDKLIESFPEKLNAKPRSALLELIGDEYT